MLLNGLSYEVNEDWAVGLPLNDNLYTDLILYKQPITIVDTVLIFQCSFAKLRACY